MVPQMILLDLDALRQKELLYAFWKSTILASMIFQARKTLKILLNYTHNSTTFVIQVDLFTLLGFLYVKMTYSIMTIWEDL